MTTTYRTTPLVDGPIVSPAMSPRLGSNVNGPSLIRVPDWVAAPLGRYYLYFADHKGRRIELAFADALAGPWTLYEPGVLALRATQFLKQPPAVPADVDSKEFARPRAPGVPSRLDDATIPHIASPDVIVDDATRSIRLYYHGLDAFDRQPSRVAVSRDGLHFDARPARIAPPYLRMFHYRDSWYGLAMPGKFVRSRDGLNDFERGPELFGPEMRHSGVWLRGDVLEVFWTRVGDAPERILQSSIDLRGDWMAWHETDPVEIRRPCEAWEGAELPIEASLRSAAHHPVHQLRDPFVFVEGAVAHLVYAIAGESGLAIAKLETAND